MIIQLFRNRKNHLYTEGELHINDRNATRTVESSADMLPEGIYTLQIVKLSARKQKLCIFDEEGQTLWTIGLGHSWISSRKHKVIAIGRRFFPGAVCRATPDYERIIDRITKAIERHETIQFIITEERCTLGEPLRFWQEPPTHGCPPSKLIIA